MDNNEKSKEEWTRKSMKRLMLMKGFIGSMKYLVKRAEKELITNEDLIYKIKILFEEYDKRKGELE